MGTEPPVGVHHDAGGEGRSAGNGEGVVNVGAVCLFRREVRFELRINAPL